jgi:fatty-acyl-CoA synthase
MHERAAVSAAPLSPVSFLLRSARVWHDQEAVRLGASSLTYREFLELVERVAGALLDAGVGAGDRVAVMLPNTITMLALHFAAPGVGAVLVPINLRLGPREGEYILRHSDPAVVITSAELAEFEEAVARAAPTALRVPSDDSTLLSINYTSGTTGEPKGAMYSHRGAYLHTLGVVAESRLDVHSRYLWTLPMFHCNGWAYTWAVTAAGATHICMDGFDADHAWGLLEGERVTHLCGAPTVFSMLAESQSATVLGNRVRGFIGGAPPAPALIERLAPLGVDITHLYGLTETYGPICVCAERPGWEDLTGLERSRLTARQGVPTIVSEPLRVVDHAMADVPADGATMGEVVMRGNNVMLGYYRDPAATAEAFTGGWFHSGDLAVMHPDGYLELRDRAKDVVISGGENIATVEVEQVIASHPGVVDVAVVGVPDERWGERPRAFVVRRPGHEVTADELQDLVGRALARFKVPRDIVFRESLPKTATGKTQKFALRDEAAIPPTKESDP